MCGRFTLTDPASAVARLFDAAPANDLPDGPRYNICPTQPVLAVTAGDRRRLVAMRWGFVPSWYRSPTDGPLIINARAETVATRPAFREAIRSRRCLIPASGFYEWTAGPNGTRLPWHIAAASGEVLAFGGVWQDWQGQPTCAIVSTAAGPDMARLHDREPLTIAPEDWPLWLGEAGHGAARLMRPRPPGFYAMHRVSPAVNSNRAEGPALIAPLADDAPG
jgi:putative SOS response-associated peptidase YedK